MLGFVCCVVLGWFVVGLTVFVHLYRYYGVVVLVSWWLVCVVGLCVVVCLVFSCWVVWVVCCCLLYGLGLVLLWFSFIGVLHLLCVCWWLFVVWLLVEVFGFGFGLGLGWCFVLLVSLLWWA